MTHARYKTVTITQFVFLALFPPILNPFKAGKPAPQPGWDDCLFATDGPEFDYVTAVSEKNVWTLVDNGARQLVSGLHTANRIGYFITRVPVPDLVVVRVNVAAE